MTGLADVPCMPDTNQMIFGFDKDGTEKKSGTRNYAINLAKKSN